MDQRTDRERRPDTLPGREARPAIGEARPPRSSWLDRLRQRRRSVLIVTALIIAGIVALVVWWVNASTFESTDDAFIDTRTVSISSQVSAAVVDVPVTDNQLVEAGAVLVRLDDRDFRAQADQAKAQVDQAQANIDNIVAQLAAQQARIDQADKQVEQAQAALTFAQQQDERYQRLVKTGAVTVETGAAILLRSAAGAGDVCRRAGQCRRHAKAASRAQVAGDALHRANGAGARRTGTGRSQSLAHASSPRRSPAGSRD